MRKCNECEETKPLEDFNKHQHKCRPCDNARAAQYRRNNLSKEKARQARWYQDNRESVLKKMLTYNESHRDEINRRNATDYQKNKELRSAQKKEYRRLNPEKVASRNIAYNAMLNGGIIRPDACSKCGRKCTPDAHHEDYSKPLDVIWLCKSCHLRLHGSQ